MKRRLTAIMLLMALVGCEKEEPRKIPFPSGDSSAKPSATPAAPASPQVPAQMRPAAPPPTDEPTKIEPAKSGAAPGMQTVSFKGFAMDIPGEWKAQIGANPMRAAQFDWPKSGKDADAPTCIVFYFGPGSGGTVEGNLSRWRGQFDEKGDPTPGKTETFSTDHAKFTLLEKTGTFKQQASMMSPEFTPMPGWAMIAAVAEIDGGPVFFRATGPEASVMAQREAMLAALKTLRKATKA
jgi:hypothetical protein